MDIGFDPVAFLTSVFAVWFAYSESRKNNKVLVKILECKTFVTAALHDKRGMYTEYRLLIRNQGISLHDPALALQFARNGGSGVINLPLKPRDERLGGRSEFSKGMIAEFGMRSYEPTRNYIDFLEAIRE